MADEDKEAPKEADVLGGGDEGEGKPTPPRNMYSYVAQAWANPGEGYLRELQHQRLIEWRRGPTIVRVERPLRIDRARALGYRAKQGIVVVRAKVRRGGLHKPKFRAGRRPKRQGLNKITMAKSIQRIAEERTARHYPNLQVLNSYWVGQDGGHKYYEVILVDPHHPVILADPQLQWLQAPQHTGRVYRGLTSAGTRGRGLRHKGKGAEKLRPSREVHKGHKKDRSTGSRD